MASTKPKPPTRTTLHRFLEFLKIFPRNKRAMLGLIIIVFFCVLAGASSILTPYDPILTERLSGEYSTPFWFKYVPGLSQPYSENFQAANNPGFTTPSSLAQWQNSTDNPSRITYDYSSEGGNNPGSAFVEYSRRGAGEGNTTTFTLTKSFTYGFSAPPKRFSGILTLQVQGVKAEMPLEITIFVINETSFKYRLYDFKFIRSTSGWEGVPYIDSYWGDLKSYFVGLANSTDPAKTIFSTTGKYVYGIDLLFRDTGIEDQEEVTVRIDEFNLRLDGTTFGLLGTDYKGRDIFTQLAYGSKISLFVGLLSATLSVLIGLFLGLLAGYIGGVSDELLMRFTDMLLVLPTLPLLLVLMAALGSSVWNLIILIGFLGWMGFARMVRSQVLTLKERSYIEAAKAVGAGRFHIISRHIIPNVVSLVYVTLALSVPGAILSEAALSWLGLFDPNVMSWGRMLNEAQRVPGGVQIWWWIIPPGIAIAVLSLSFILIGYALDEMLNPKLRVRR